MTGLRFANLVVSYDGVRALDGVSATFANAGLVAIIGPNGAGKTTLFDAITGFVPPDTGECYVGEREISGLAPAAVARAGIARTFQQLRLIRQTTVMENVLLAGGDNSIERLWRAVIRFGVRKKEKTNRTRAMDLLQSVGLSSLADRLSSELSYGQQKVLSLACAIATDASVLLLDEPVTGVDIVLQEQIMKLLSIASKERLVVFAEHEVGVVRRFADSLVVMDQGRFVAEGSPREVLGRPEILEAYVG